jgi:rhamnosyltransferase
MPRETSVWAAIICYRASADAIRPLVQELLEQVDRVLIVDNGGSDSGLHQLDGPTLQYLAMPGNLGTAGAMNQVWNKARAEGIDFVVCFDQDSRIPPGFVDALTREFCRLEASGRRPGAIGPVWQDTRTERSLRPIAPAAWRRRRPDPDAVEALEVDHLITSGCLVHRRTYEMTGPFDEGLFLDYVDIEWSLRARARGFHFFVTRKARMAHRIGDSVISILGRSLWVHQPQRQYLLVRNHLLLWRRPFIPLSWKARDSLQVLMKISLLLLLRAPRLERLRWVGRALSDGLRGRSGPIM